MMVVTDQRVLWSYVGDARDLALDIAFKDVVGLLGSEGEGGMVLEAAEPRYVETAEGHTTIAMFRLKGHSSAVEIVRFVEAHVPPAAREQIPDVQGTERRQTYASREGATISWSAGASLPSPPTPAPRTGEMLSMFSPTKHKTAQVAPVVEGLVFGDTSSRGRTSSARSSESRASSYSTSDQARRQARRFSRWGFA